MAKAAWALHIAWGTVAAVAWFSPEYRWVSFVLVASWLVGEVLALLARGYVRRRRTRDAC